ncbi:MAG: winged helix-turn-helix domain-containing protein [Bryobacterales bacterium]|nr:winged helix-turn-helix domain-containing protein [Bryobacterales bacterium]
MEYRFGSFRLNGDLFFNHVPIRLEPKALRLLAVLVERHGDVVSKEELRRTIWPGQLVTEENSIEVLVFKVRKALKEHSGDEKTTYIETKHTRGYRFVVPVQVVNGPEGRTGAADVLDRDEGNSSVSSPRELLETPESAPEPPKSKKRRWPPWLVIGIVGGVLVVVVLSVVLARRDQEIRPIPAPRRVTAGRFTWRVTAEGRAPHAIDVPEVVDRLAVTPDGSKLLGAAYLGHRIWVFDVASREVKWVDAGMKVGAIEVAPDGRSFWVASAQDGLVEVRLPGLEVGPAAPTGGGTYHIAISPDSRQIYLAMMHLGVKRYDVGAKQLVTVTEQPSPHFVDVSPSGEQLAISYQNGGPKGREGHDSVGVMDTRTGATLQVFSGPPMVGGGIRYSPDGEELWVDGWDACRTAKYDHEGCPAVPAWFWQVFRLKEGWVKTVSLPEHSGSVPIFLSRTEVAAVGHSVVVVDAIKGTFREQMRGMMAGWAAVSADRSQFYVAGPDPRTKKPVVMKLEREPEECAVNESALVHFLPFDGAEVDWVAYGRVSGRENWEYAPGVVGQALKFDGESRPELHSSAAVQFPDIDSTLVMYLKPEKSGPMAVLEKPKVNKSARWAIGLNREMKLTLGLESAEGKTFELEADRSLAVGSWNHIAVVRSGDAFHIYVNGAAAGTKAVPGLQMRDFARPMAFGWSKRQTGRYVGLVDELAMWGRALADREIARLVSKRAEGNCKP